MKMSMSSSKEHFNISKTENFVEWYSQIIKIAEILDQRYPIKGMEVFMAYGYRIHDNIMKELENLFDKTPVPHDKVLFPTLIPEDEFQKESTHIKGFEDSVYWVERGGFDNFERRLVMRPTSEVAMYPMFSLWIRSYQDLPTKVYQTCTIFRYETKMTKPLIRVREIPWNEAHTAHESYEDAEDQIQEAWVCYDKLVDKLGITGLRLVRPEWDKFPGAVYTTVMDTILPDGKSLQISGIHQLGDNFAKVFDIKFLDTEGNQRFAFQTCYGVSTRLLAAVISTHGDDGGLLIPYEFAPIKVIIVPIISRGQEEKVMVECEELQKLLLEHGISARVDDSDERPGNKFYFWEMKGVPLRLEVGPKEVQENTVTVVRRDTKEKKILPQEGLVAAIEALGKEIHKNIRAKAEQHLKENIRDAESLDKAGTILKEKGGFVRVPFCTLDSDGKDCDEEIKDATGGEVRGSLYPEPEKTPVDKKCISCGRDATFYVYLTKAY